jgi:hypothetical protein
MGTLLISRLADISQKINALIEVERLGQITFLEQIFYKKCAPKILEKKGELFFDANIMFLFDF